MSRDQLDKKPQRGLEVGVGYLHTQSYRDGEGFFVDLKFSTGGCF